MPRKQTGPVGHTGQTKSGNVRDVKVDRVVSVTIYKRGDVYYLYYRENRKSERQRIDGNLAVARATAAKVAAALGEDRPSPLGFSRTSPEEMVVGYPMSLLPRCSTPPTSASNGSSPTVTPHRKGFGMTKINTSASWS